MRVLYVCHRFPFPPKRGGKIRPFNMIRHFTAQGHEVTVASLVRSDEEAKAGEGLAQHCKKYLMERVHNPLAMARMVARLPTGGPSSMGFFYSPKLKARIARELHETSYDLIFVHCSSVAQYVEHAAGIPKIMDFGDMDSQKWISYGPMKPFPFSLGYYLEGLKMQLAEVEIARKFDTCTTTTKAELATLEGLGSGARTAWFPNGVDAEAFKPTTEPYDPNTVCFVGRMDYFPNQQGMLWFCRDVWPRLREEHAELKLLIVGADPSREIQALARLPGVTVTGSVPEVQPYVQRAALTVAPLFIARGTQNKILESLSMGVPVVSSTLAAGGVDAVPEEHILTADRPELWVSQVLRLVRDPAERRRFAEAGRARMLSNHTWASSMARLDGIVDRTVHSTHGRAS